MKSSILAIAAAALIGMVTPAGAATYAVHYTATSGTIMPTMANFRIVTTDHMNGIGGFDILSAGGDVNGVAITGLAAINPPGFATDNVFYTGTPHFDLFGLGWTSGSTTGNLFFQGGTFILAQFDPSLPRAQRYFNQTSGDVTVAAVPEPASWAMLVVGFGVVGTALRTRKAEVIA